MKLVVLFGMIAALCSEGSAYDATKEGHKVTHIVWFDITIAGESVGQIKIGLFGRLVPLTVYNFVDLSTQSIGKGYKNSKLFDVEKGFRIGGGDWKRNDGSGGTTSFEGEIFDEEVFKIKQYGAGWMIMQHDETYNTSLFFISTGKRRPVARKHIVFGKVIKGMNVVRKIENVEVDYNFRPTKDIVIDDCGAEIADPPFYVTKSPATD